MGDIELFADRHEAEVAERHFIHLTTEEFKTVGDLPEEFALFQSDSEVESATEQLGCAEEGYAYIFGFISEGCIVRAFGSYGAATHRAVYEIPVP